MIIRLEKMCRALKEMALDYLLISNPDDLYYFTGHDFSRGRLLIHSTGATLYVDGRYIEEAKEQSTVPTLLLRSDSQFLQELMIPSGSQIGFDSDHLSYEEGLFFLKEFEKKEIRVKAIPSPSRELRIIKDLNEIHLMKKAAHLAELGMEFITESLQEGMSEKKMALQLQTYWLELGSPKPSFEPTIAFGSNTSKPHHHSGDTILKIGDPVLCDIGAVFDHYCSDMTRVFYFKECSDEMARMHHIVLKGQQIALSLCQPGAFVADIDQAVRQYFEKEQCLELYTHSLGHGVGLQIHEYPRVSFKSKEQLQEGMIITVEPGIYKSGIGGVRIEDMVLITKDGPDLLTHFNKEITVIVN